MMNISPIILLVVQNVLELAVLTALLGAGAV